MTEENEGQDDEQGAEPDQPAAAEAVLSEQHWDDRVWRRRPW